MSKFLNATINSAPKRLATAISLSLGMAANINAAPVLEEVLVTAQKREQSMQQVPIAVTALTEEMIRVNQVVTVTDLSSLAPGLTVRPAAGGSNIASFSMRGVTSYGVVPGSDKQVSIYLDGVYISSPRASIFALPDIAQLEVLRGPQGTLFGRNATAGAVSVTTRDPSGELAFVQELTFGSRDLHKTRTSLDLPAIGKLSLYGSYVSYEQNGDIKNLGAGTTWDRSAFGYSSFTSPKYLGTKDTESIFVAAQYDVSDQLGITYKYDKTTEGGTAEAVVPFSLNPDLLGPAVGSLLNEWIANSGGIDNIALRPNIKRPDSVNNFYNGPVDQKIEGHSLRAVWDISEQLTLSNIASYREAYQATTTHLAGIGGLIAGGPVTESFYGSFYPGGELATPGAAGCVLCFDIETDAQQWSNEIFVNYDAKSFNLTAGLIYFKSNDRSGGPIGGGNNISFFPIVDNKMLAANAVTPEGVSYNDAESTAAYAQADYHLTEKIDVVTGARITQDKKSGTYRSGPAGSQTLSPFTYSDTKPNFLVGVNYQHDAETMVYAKASTAFVSGGAIGGVEFKPEEATSFEVGMKADYFDNSLRTNISIYDVTYEHPQSAQGGRAIGRPELSTVIVDQGGNIDTWGVEFESSYLPIESLILNFSAGYQDITYKDVNPILFGSVFATSTDEYLPSITPEWTASLGANYQSQPLFSSTAYLDYSISANWRDKMRLHPNPNAGTVIPNYKDMEYSDAGWVVNARIAIREIQLESLKGELAVWGKNLTDNDDPIYGLLYGFANGGNFMESRSVGVDFIVRY